MEDLDEASNVGVDVAELVVGAVEADDDVSSIIPLGLPFWVRLFWLPLGSRARQLVTGELARAGFAKRVFIGYKGIGNAEFQSLSEKGYVG
jgi:hypothetical protein